MADEAGHEDPWRMYALDVHHQTSRDIDRAILTVSSGIVGASAIFTNPSGVSGLLISSWGLFGGAILFTLASLLLSQRATERAIEADDAGENFDPATFDPTRCATYAAVVLFVVGLILLVIFGATNAT